MNAKSQVIFHVGLPKAASTFLQRAVFPEFTGIRFVKKHDFEKHDNIIKHSGKPVLLSTEMDIAKGGKKARKLYQIAEKYPHTKIILVLRRHDKWIASRYKYSIRKNSALDFDEFFNLSTNNGIYRIEHLYYQNIIKKIEDLFDKEPLVVFQEELKQNPEKTIALIAEFCNAEIDISKINQNKVNKSFNNKQLIVLRRFNKKIPFNESKHGKFIKKMRAGVIHSLAFFANIFIKEKDVTIELIPENRLKEIKNYFEKDWKETVIYVAGKRELLINDI